MKNIIRKLNKNSKVNILASSSNNFSIELIHKVGKKDFHSIKKISQSLVKDLGSQAELSDNIVLKYFNNNTFAFIARLNNNIIGYIVGVPLEIFKTESWSHFDINLDKENTIYTYSFAFDPHYRRKNGYAKTLKRLYSNHIKKRGYKYITGHVQQGITQNFNYDVDIVKIFPTWYSQKKPFEYYRRQL